jgi:hypothetical protein
MWMADLRVQHSEPSTDALHAVARDGRPPQHGPREDPSRHHERDPGAAELAVALSESARGDALVARYEEGSDGTPLIRIVDRVRGDTVALVTPDELRDLAQETGLPPGLLIQVSS